MDTENQNPEIDQTINTNSIEKTTIKSNIFKIRIPLPIVIILLIGISFIVIAGTIAYSEKIRGISYNINIQGTDGKQIPLTYGAETALSNPDYFNSVKSEFIKDKADFIEADLSKMKLNVYKQGDVILSVNIATKGRPGSWWETPAGIYKINRMEAKHFSSIGHVWMPYSLNFQGNFFIHGHTYYNDGTPTSKAFTGGCIRLETDDAKKVYDIVTVGMPVLVYENSFSSDNFSYSSEISNMNSDIYLAADLGNNHAFTGKNTTEQVPIASITKLMTAIITTEYINLDNSVTVPEEAIVYTSKARLHAGEKYRVYQLLFPLLMESSNEAAETIARAYGRSAFVKYMNDKAKAIGMTHTTFVDPSGASEGNISTAEDLYMLAKYIYNSRSFVLDITSGKLKANAYGDSGFSGLGNFNDFVDNEYFVGGKNGKTTAALETNISIFNFPSNGTKRPIVLIVLKSKDEKKDSSLLLNFVLNNFKEVSLTQ